MKNNKVYMNSAVIGTVLNNHTMQDVANQFIQIVKEDGYDLNEQEVKSDGVIFRRKRDTDISKNDVVKLFIKVLQYFMNSEDTLVGYLSDHYDLSYADKLLDVDTIKDLVDVKLNGRLIYLEMDM